MVKPGVAEHHAAMSPQPAREATADAVEVHVGVGASALGAHAGRRSVVDGFDTLKLVLGERELIGVWDLAVGEGLLRSEVHSGGTGEQMYALVAPGR